MSIIFLLKKGDDFMAFTDNFKSIEKIKKDNSTKYLKQELLMVEPLSDIASVVVNDKTVTVTFAKLVSKWLSKSDFSMFNKVLLNNEVEFITNSIGHGDILTFKYGSNKQVNEIKYQSSDKLVNIVLKANENNAYVVRTINMGDRIHETKSTFKNIENGYHQNSFINRIIAKEDDFTTSVSDIYEYDVENDELVKEFKVVTIENGKTISKSSIRNVIDKSNYVVEDGKFYTITKKEENKKMNKCKKLENKLVEDFK